MQLLSTSITHKSSMTIENESDSDRENGSATNDNHPKERKKDPKLKESNIHSISIENTPDIDDLDANDDNSIDATQESQFEAVLDDIDEIQQMQAEIGGSASVATVVQNTSVPSRRTAFLSKLPFVEIFQAFY